MENKTFKQPQTKLQPDNIFLEDFLKLSTSEKLDIILNKAGRDLFKQKQISETNALYQLIEKEEIKLFNFFEKYVGTYGQKKLNKKTYNQGALIKTKITDAEMYIKINSCDHSITLHNRLTNPNELLNAIFKVQTLIHELKKLLEKLEEIKADPEYKKLTRKIKTLKNKVSKLEPKSPLRSNNLQ